MDNNAGELTRETRKVIGLQILIGGLIGAGFFVAEGPWQALSGWFGGLISLTGTFLLARGVERAGRIARHNPKKSMQVLYFGAVQRFVLIAALLGCGLLLFKLDPLALVTGLGVTQLAYVVGMRGLRHARTD